MFTIANTDLDWFSFLKENNITDNINFWTPTPWGMTKDKFNECYSNLDNENLILEGVMAAQKDFNIKSTPSFIVNGNLIEGNKNIKEFRQIIDKILSE